MRNTLKRDPLGTISLQGDGTVCRDTSGAGRGQRWLARCLARRESRALRRLAGVPGIPALVADDRERVVRSYLPGAPMHHATFDPAPYFRDALALLRRLHRHGVAHNDLAKEANWICMPDNRAGIVDFQLAVVAPRRGRWFRRLAREDLRHLLKHKRHYAPELLTTRERAILASPSAGAHFWRFCVKPPYRLVTRRLLGWAERPGAEEREWQPRRRPARTDSDAGRA